jgi:hypothetical protein
MSSRQIQYNKFQLVLTLDLEHKSTLSYGRIGAPSMTKELLWSDRVPRINGWPARRRGLRLALGDLPAEST